MQRHLIWILTLVAGLVTVPGTTRGADKLLKMSTTTSTENSGLLDVLLPKFTEKTGIQVKVFAKGTGAVIRDGVDGNVDIIFVHAKEREERFVADGYGAYRLGVMHNDFVIVGPTADPAEIKGMGDAAMALRRIAENKVAFVSRGDDSGTHTKEQALWKATGLPLKAETTDMVKKGKKYTVSSQRPEGLGHLYLSIGQGMGKTLTYAEEKQAYTLADRGTYLRYKVGRKQGLDLEILCQGDPELFNPYGIIPINPERHPHVKFEWADQFARSGAKYVVPTSKHHDGYCLWPSKEANKSWGRPWNSVDIGPKRDLMGELAEAVRVKGLKFGFYYSLYEWFNPLYTKKTFEKFRDKHYIPQFKDVVTRYEPSIIFADGEWDWPSEDWRSPELLAWLFNETACKDEVVINDRWGKESRSQHGGYFTTEYGHVGGGKDELAEGRPWEENRGMGASFGFNRNESIAEYKSGTELVHLLVDTVSRGGNLLLDIGPDGDGTIPVIMQDRLLQIGAWLDVNGDAIYSTRRWREVAEGDDVRFTTKDGVVYAICLKWPGQSLTLTTPKADGKVTAHLLGHEEALACTTADDGITVTLPVVSPDNTNIRHAYVIKLEGVE